MQKFAGARWLRRFEQLSSGLATVVVVVRLEVVVVMVVIVVLMLLLLSRPMAVVLLKACVSIGIPLLKDDDSEVVVRDNVWVVFSDTLPNTCSWCDVHPHDSLPPHSGVALANQTKERAKTKSSWISPIFVNSGVFP